MRISDWSSDVCSSDRHCDRLADRFRWWCFFGAKRIAEAELDRVRAITRAQLRVGRVTEQIESAVIGLQEAIVERRSDLLGEVECETRTGQTEEHTSELQSIMRNSYAVFCLKKYNNNHAHQKRGTQ